MFPNGIGPTLKVFNDVIKEFLTSFSFSTFIRTISYEIIMFIHDTTRTVYPLGDIFKIHSYMNKCE